VGKALIFFLMFGAPLFSWHISIQWLRAWQSHGYPADRHPRRNSS